MADEPIIEYEYAGFLFELRNGRMVAKPGQHSAAYKERHARAAMECYLDDQKK